MTEAYDLFAEEEEVLRHARTLLQQEQLDVERLYACLTQTTDQFARLLKQMQSLIRLSDRKEGELKRLNRKLRESTSLLEYRASHDSLTGILNRGAMFQKMEEERSRGPFSLVIVDIDYFKRINDTYGHPAGDFILAALTSRIEEHLHEEDHLGRVGGEEFAVILRRHPERSLFEAADAIRRLVSAEPFGNDERPPIPVSVSLGVTASLPGEDLDTTYKRADTALYHAKNSGRNRTVVLMAEDMHDHR